MLNWEKCQFILQESIFLGHKVSFKGIKVDPAKLDVLRNLPIPTIVTGLWSFFGHVGFYRPLILGFSTVAKPLNELLQKDVEFNFLLRDASVPLIVLSKS